MAAALPGLSAYLPDGAVHRDHGAGHVSVPRDVPPGAVRHPAGVGLGVPRIHGHRVPADRAGHGPGDHRQILAIRRVADDGAHYLRDRIAHRPYSVIR